MARKLLDQLQPKWHPFNLPPFDNLTHTPNRKLANEVAHENNGTILFNPSVTSNDSLSQNFRVFTDSNVKCADPGYRKYPLIAEHAEATTVHTAGSCLEDGYEDAQAGSGVWFGPEDLRNTALKIPGPSQSKQIGQLVAVLYAIRKTPPFAPLHITTSSKYIISCFTQKLTNWEECGWIKVPNKEFIRPIVSQLRARGAITTFAKAVNPAELENANLLAKQGTHKLLNDDLDLTLNQKFNLTGAQLSMLSQAVAYKGIQERTQPTPRLSTVINLDTTRHAVQRITGHLPTDAAIWYSIRSKDITRTIRVFLWKLLHKAHRCGDYWLQIPDFEHRSKCHECGVEDSMTHILTECSAPGQREVWSMTKDVWEAKHSIWPAINNLGTIIGCGLAKFTSKTGRRKFGAERLYRILMTESAHLIWKIRCERVFGKNDRRQGYTTQELKNRWLSVINKRLALDQAMTDRKYATKAISTKVVLCTWSGVLQNESSLPQNWINYSGVLVGIRPPEQSWWQRPNPP